MEALLLKNSKKCLIVEGDFNATVGDKSQRTLDDSLRALLVESNERSWEIACRTEPSLQPRVRKFVFLLRQLRNLEMPQQENMA